MDKPKQYHCICHGTAERASIARMIGCTFQQVHVLHRNDQIKKLDDQSTVYNLNNSFDQAILADFCRKRENIDVLMWSISQEKWVKTT
jgi:hypothetical protein